MSTLGLASSTDLWWSTRRSRWLLVTVHIPFLLVAPLATAIGLEGPAENGWLVAALAVAVGALALRHSLGVAGGVRPRGWPLTLAGHGLLTFVPLLWFADDWISIQWMFICSAALLLTGWPRLICVVGPMLGSATWMSVKAVSLHATVVSVIYTFVYWTVGLATGAVCLYGATQLVRAVDELFATRVELAESMIGRERGRLSRDLHDLLGQSLSAVSLKGDLALALLRGGSRSEAEQEIRSLTGLARTALHDIRHVVRGQHPVSLQSETRGAGVLLTAASIEATIEAEVGRLPGPVDELLGWATREGVTNMLRHSEASCCSIRVERQEGSVVLEIVNDGATAPSETGTGIAGLAERARALGGSVSAGRLADGEFRLLVRVPEAEEAIA